MTQSLFPHPLNILKQTTIELCYCNTASNSRVFKTRILAASDYCLTNKTNFITPLNNNFKEHRLMKLKVIHEIDRKWTVASHVSFKKFYGKMLVDFCLNLFLLIGFILGATEKP